jgi:hypothetical protein
MFNRFSNRPPSRMLPPHPSQRYPEEYRYQPRPHPHPRNRPPLDDRYRGYPEPPHDWQRDRFPRPRFEERPRFDGERPRFDARDEDRPRFERDEDPRPDRPRFDSRDKDKRDHDRRPESFRGYV